MSLIHEMSFFFINSQLHLVVFVLNRFLAAVRNEMRETLHQQLFICSESLYPEIAGERRINTKVLDMNPTKATDSVDNVAPEV